MLTRWLPTLRWLMWIILLIPTSVFASKSPEPRVLGALRSNEAIKVDGVLDESIWQAAEVADEFIQHAPIPGGDPSQRSEVRVLYDDESLYIGAMLFDSEPDSILSQLTVRDEIGNTDSFGIWISCFRDGINAFQFVTTPSGVQYDAQISAFGEDSNWNAVWQCNTSITDDGWIAEFKIPYSALRFPAKPEQLWDINFERSIRRYRETSFWHPVDPKVAGVVNQSGVLRNIIDIQPPVRLFFYPYAIAYAELDRDTDGRVQTGTRMNAGMDLKYGISDAFTLDMTLIPDFGQARSDNKVLNLSPFEVFFEEQRPFFTEGTELFNKGDLFYSRRVGGDPVNAFRAFENLVEHEEVSTLPSETRLLNASKISGRTPGGLGIGVFNAVTGTTYAVVRDTLSGNERQVEVAPLSNYSVLVADQNLGNNSYVTLINTNVTRDGSTYDANVSGLEFDIRDPSNSMSINGRGAYSKKFNWDDASSDNGYTYNLAVEKISGQFNVGAEHAVMTKYYDNNDLGFLPYANFTSTGVSASYNIFEPFGPFNRMWSELELSYNHLHSLNAFTGAGIEGELGFNTRSFDTFSLQVAYEPVGSNDYFEPRVDGRFFHRPENYYFGGWFSSDYRRRLAVDIGSWNTRVPNSDWLVFNWRVSPRFRVNDQVMMIYVYSRQNSFNEQGYTDVANDDRIIFGQRDVITHTHVFTLNYIFTNRMGLSFRLRHYWRTVAYDQFFELNEEGNLHQDVVSWENSLGEQGYLDHQTTRDLSYNAFNIDMVYTWVFSPGSELRVVWKNAIEDASQSVPTNYTDNVDRLFSLPQGNSLSIRLLYFIDYLNFTRKGKFIEN